MANCSSFAPGTVTVSCRQLTTGSGNGSESVNAFLHGSKLSVLGVGLSTGHSSFPAVWCCWSLDVAEPVCLPHLPLGQNRYVSDWFESTHRHDSQANTDTAIFTDINIIIALKKHFTK